MKDKTKLNTGTPIHAEGKFCLELTDPINGKVTERIQEKNTIFPHTLFVGNWAQSLNSSWLVLSDSDYAIDPKVPYILGNPLGYGRPGLGSAGALRGTYNAGLQILCDTTRGVGSRYWRFAYDFTAGQAIGIIKTIGITNQFTRNYDFNPQECVNVKTHSNTYYTFCKISDGRRVYDITTAGVVSIYDYYTSATASTVNVSAIVGSASGDNKFVGYDADTGHFFIVVCSNTAANRKVFEFSDNTFLTLLNTYNISNFTFNSSYSAAAFVFAGDYFYYCTNSMAYANYKTNTAAVSIPLANHAGIQAIDSLASYSPSYHSMMRIPGTPFILSMSGHYSGSTYTPSSYSCWGWIVDTDTKAQCGYKAPPLIETYNNSYEGPAVIVNRAGVPTIMIANYAVEKAGAINAAVAAKKLDTPLVKPSNRGLTATYEIEVFY